VCAIFIWSFLMSQESIFLVLNLIGAFVFGVFVGWVTSSIFRRAKRNTITDISAVIGAVAGAAVIGLFSKESGAFGVYSIGLPIGFFIYIFVATRRGAARWLGAESGDDTVNHDDPSRSARNDPLPPTMKK
jgi:NhaP-type Na+/H+ or K+/H+ antiporter